MNLIGWNVLTYSLTILGFIFMFKRYGRFWLISIPATFMFIYVVFNVLGATYLCDELPFHEIKYLLAINLGVVLHIIGFVLADHALQFNFRSEMRGFVEKQISYDSDNVYKVLFTFVALIIAAVTAYYLSQLSSIPLVEMLTSENKAIELAKSRELATTSFAGKYHRYAFFFRTLLPFISLVSLAACYKRKDLFWEIAFIVLFLFTVIMLIIDLQKAPVLFYLISVVYLIFVLNKKVEIKKILLVVLLFLVLLVVMYLSIMGLAGRGAADVVEKISLRLFVGQTKGIYTAFTVFPAKHDFLYGISFPNPAGIFPYETFELTKYVFQEMYGYGRYIVGTAPTPYFMEFYMNFGYFAMLVMMLVGSFILQVIQITFIRSGKTILNLGLYAYILVHLGKMGITSFFNIFGISLVMLFIFISLFNMAVNTFRGLSYENSNSSNE